MKQTTTNNAPFLLFQDDAFEAGLTRRNGGSLANYSSHPQLTLELLGGIRGIHRNTEGP